MNDDYRHVIRQSFAAVRELALGPGPIQGRLEGACDELLTLRSAEMPAAVREAFLATVTAITEIGDLDGLAEEAAVALAGRMLAFHERMLLTLTPELAGELQPNRPC